MLSPIILQLCRSSPSTRRSMVPLSTGAGGTDGQHTFAWLSCLDSTSSPLGMRGEHKANQGPLGKCHDNGEASPTTLCFGSVDWDLEGRWSRHPVGQTPAHVLFVPDGRFIIVACEGSSVGCFYPRGQESERRNEKDTHSNLCNRGSPSLRVFNADSMEEVWRGLVHCNTSDITGLALLEPPVVKRCHPRGSMNRSCDVVGGGVVAMACTKANDARYGQVSVDPWENVEVDPPVSCVLAFEIARCHRGGGTGSQPVETSQGCGSFGASHKSGTSLEPLGAGDEISGACFCLKTIAKRFVAAAVNDRILVMGWAEKEGLKSGQSMGLCLTASHPTPHQGCITALATCGNFVAIAELLHSVAVYRFDEDEKTLFLLGIHRSGRLVSTCLTLVPRWSHQATQPFPDIVATDQSTGTMAVLSCSLPVEEPNQGNLGPTGTVHRMCVAALWQNPSTITYLGNIGGCVPSGFILGTSTGVIWGACFITPEAFHALAGLQESWSRCVVKSNTEFHLVNRCNDGKGIIKGHGKESAVETSSGDKRENATTSSAQQGKNQYDSRANHNKNNTLIELPGVSSLSVESPGSTLPVQGFGCINGSFLKGFIGGAPGLCVHNRSMTDDDEVHSVMHALFGS
ncbi:unnamed protein product [Choristocarpus tenellus]